MESSGKTLISIVLPVCNEAGSVRSLLGRLKTTAQTEPGYEWEFLFVDDGSRDGTASIVEEEHRGDPRVKLLALTRNFGHQIALSAGLMEARGDAVVTLDGDGQHPPEVLPAMLREWEQGRKVVLGVRESTQTGIGKRASSRLFYRLMMRIADVPVHPDAADFRLTDREVVDQLNSLPEKARFLRGLVGWLGHEAGVVKYHEAGREAGRSKYSLSRMVVFALDALTSFSAAPLRLATLLGFVVTLLAGIYGLYALTIRLFVHGATVPGWTSVIIAVLFLGGIQLLSLGILGEYLHRVFDEVKRRPLYVVKRRVGL